MRALVLIAILMLAGCSESPAPIMDRPDSASPIYGGVAPEKLQLFGPEGNGTTDADVAVARCADRDNVYAYAINTTGSAIRLYAPKGAPNATSYLIATFDDVSGGLGVTSMWRGGTAMSLSEYHALFITEWAREMPHDITVQPGSDGIVRIAIACTGDGVVNYVVDSTSEPQAPHYLTPTLATGFDAFMAVGSESGSIYIPPTAISQPEWSKAGNVNITYTETAPEGVRIGQTLIQWTGGPGWSTARCEHGGISEHGEWSYTADLHGDTRAVGNYMAQDIATLYITQDLLFGEIAVEHGAGGTTGATLAWDLEHLASSRMGWVTVCEGAHLGTPLEVLFDAPAATQWFAQGPLL